MRLNIFPLVIFMSFLVGCSAFETTDEKYQRAWGEYRDVVQLKYLGKHVDYLMVEFGVPTGKATLGNDNQVLDYISYRGEYRCEDRFIANAKGIIIDSKHTGQNGCVSIY